MRDEGGEVMIQPLTYTAKELPGILHISRTTVFKLIADGKIKSVRAGRKIIVPAWAIDEFLGQAK
ncbi:MAG: binding domain protein, excisionase family [Firmicutes bacterium]|nr:binding domain protein, excisionase family [Bacillota bacterium]